jgi:hypothetical protein
MIARKLARIIMRIMGINALDSLMVETLAAR